MLLSLLNRTEFHLLYNCSFYNTAHGEVMAGRVPIRPTHATFAAEREDEVRRHLARFFGRTSNNPRDRNFRQIFRALSHTNRAARASVRAELEQRRRRARGEEEMSELNTSIALLDAADTPDDPLRLAPARRFLQGHGRQFLGDPERPEREQKGKGKKQKEEEDDDGETVSVKSFETCCVMPPDEAHVVPVVAHRLMSHADNTVDDNPGEPAEDRSSRVPGDGEQYHAHVVVVPASEEEGAATLIQSAFRGFMV